MKLKETGLNVIYIKPQIDSTVEENKKQLTKFVALFAQAGFKEISLNPNSDILSADKFCE